MTCFSAKPMDAGGLHCRPQGDAEIGHPDDVVWTAEGLIPVAEAPLRLQHLFASCTAAVEPRNALASSSDEQACVTMLHIPSIPHEKSEAVRHFEAAHLFYQSLQVRAGHRSYDQRSLPRAFGAVSAESSMSSATTSTASIFPVMLVGMVHDVYRFEGISCG